MKLKTLKDLEHSEDLKHQDSKLVYSWKLKEEAVKWVIHGAKKRKNMFKMFMDFFNITEEELKKGDEDD